MRTIVVGAGFTGVQLSRALVARGDDVTLVESDREKALAARDRLDCSVVEAPGNDPATLAAADVGDADALVALTDDDETNLVTCALARAAHPGIRAVARVRNHGYFEDGRRPAASPFAGVAMVNPDAEAAAAISFAAGHGAVGNVTVLDGGYGIVELAIAPESPLAGAVLRDFTGRAGRRCLVAYAETAGGAFIPDGTTTLSAGDRIGVVALPEDIDPLLDVAGSPPGEPLRRVAVFGAGRIGTLATERLLAGAAPAGGFFRRRMSRREIVLVDPDPDRCREASRRFQDVRVICGDITESDLLAEEGLDAGDLAVAATGNYERNLVMAAYLKSRGARRTIALTASAEFDEIARKLGVDVTVPLRDVVVDAISGHLRGSAIRAVHSVCDRLFEIVECDIRGGSRAAGKTLREIASPGEYLALLAGNAGQGGFTIPGGDTVLAAGGKAVLVARAGSRRVERLLAPGK